MAVISLATLLNITIPDTGEVLRYQNYQTEVFAFSDQLYSYAGFEIKTYPQSDLSMGSEDMVIAVRNTQLIRAILRAHNNLRGAVVLAHYVQPGTDVPCQSWLTEVSTTTIEGSAVIFALKGPTNALSGALASKTISAADFPQLPHYLPQL